MLKKLLKYDLKYIYKTLIIFYLVSLSLAIITRGFFYLSHSSIFHILGQITSGVTIIMIFSIIVNTIVRVWTRFTQNMYKDESYLTHTLPVKKGTIYLSKFLSSLMTMFSSILVIFLTIAMAYYSKENLEFVKLSLEGLATIYDSTAIKLILILMFAFFLEIAFLMQVGYTGIILGHRSESQRIVKSIFFGALFYIVTSLISLLLLFLLGLVNKDILNLFMTNTVSDLTVIKQILYLAILFYTTVLGFYYLLNQHLLKQGIDVE